MRRGVFVLVSERPENGKNPQFDAAASLAEARKKLPFKRFLEQHGADKDCRFCEANGTVQIVTRPITTGRISRESVDALGAYSILRVIEPRLPLKKNMACCPFHQEKNPSFSVSPDKNMYHCFGCHISGGPIKFVMDFDHVDFKTALEKLSQEAGIALVYDTRGEETVFKCSNTSCKSGTWRDDGEWDEMDFLMAESALNVADGKAPYSRKEAFMVFLKEAGVWKERTRYSLSKNKKITHFKPLAPATDPVAEKEMVVPPANALPISDGATPSVASVPEPEPETACNAKKGEAQCGKPAQWRHPNYPDGAFCDECKSRALEFFPNDWHPLGDEPIVSKITNDDELAGVQGALKKLRMRIGAIRAFNRDSSKQEQQAKAAEASIAAYQFEKEQAARKKNEDAEVVPLGLTILQDFYSRLTLIELDEWHLFFDRGSSSKTSNALGLVSNVETNLKILEELSEKYEWEEKEASGLFLPEDRRKKLSRRVNPQFYGFGQICRKPEDLRRDNDDKIVWGFSDEGWCDACKKKYKATQCPKCKTALRVGHPILIPYFGADGKLIKLRPHKGGASGRTVAGATRLYIPRVKGAATAQTFFKVIITEGEFKGGALWQTLGAGRPDKETPFGVCTLPGITFGKHFELREELHSWLEQVKCQQVYVAFDDEDKSDKAFRDGRHDSLIWASYLANDLMRKTRVNARVLPSLPEHWRTGKKADWDGALAKIIHAK